jgi:hypothetical protein
MTVKLKWVRKVYSDGRHNAFTGLARFKDLYVLAFRNGARHSGEDGRQVLMSSRDGEHWEKRHEKAFPAPHPLPPGTPMDYRDSYLLPLDGELRLYSFALAPLLPSDEWMFPPHSNVQITRDGETWTEPRMVSKEAILWKPIFWQDRFWCAGYRRVPATGSVVELYQSEDGLAWSRTAAIAEGNETFLVPLGGDCLRAFIRTKKMPYHMEIWESPAPYVTWRKAGAIPLIIQAPHALFLNGELYLFGRETPAYGEMRCPLESGCVLRRTKMWRVSGTAAEEVIEFPSFGDTSYVGTALRPDGLLLVSYYSQHERELGVPAAKRGGNHKPADVFVAGIQA